MLATFPICIERNYLNKKVLTIITSLLTIESQNKKVGSTTGHVFQRRTLKCYICNRIGHILQASRVSSSRKDSQSHGNSRGRGISLSRTFVAINLLRVIIKEYYLPSAKYFIIRDFKYILQCIYIYTLNLPMDIVYIDILLCNDIYLWLCLYAYIAYDYTWSDGHKYRYTTKSREPVRDSKVLKVTLFKFIHLHFRKILSTRLNIQIIVGKILNWTLIVSTILYYHKINYTKIKSKSFIIPNIFYCIYWTKNQ